MAGVGAGAYFFYEPTIPTSVGRADNNITLPGFAVKNTKKKLCIARGKDRKKTLKAALSAMGTMAAFIKQGDHVLLKVNAAFASPPGLCATSHPDLVFETARLCFEAGAAKVVVTDNPINDPATCFALTGIEKATKKAGAKLMAPRPSMFYPYTLKDGRLIKDWPLLYGPLQHADKVIGLAPVKDHHRSGASMILKNWYGLLGGNRSIFHQDIHTIIKELALMIEPTLVILDGTVSMVANGPTGGSMADLKPTNTMIVSTDPVAADAYGATLLGLETEDLPFIGKAEKAGVGTSDFSSLDPIMVQGV